MRELAAVGIVNISAVAGYNNSELKITLTEEYSWFKGEQFKDLLNRHKIVLNDSDDESTRIEAKDSTDTGQSQIPDELADRSNENDTESKQSSLIHMIIEGHSHVLKQNPPQRHREKILKHVTGSKIRF